MKIRSILCLITVVLCSCSKDPVLDEAIKSEFTIKSTQNLFRENREHWVIISDKSGKILASGELTKDSTFITSSAVEGRVNITLLEVYEDWYILRTYTEIMANDTWVIQDQSEVRLNQRDLKATINIQNSLLDTRNNFFMYSISNAHGSVFDGGGGAGTDLRIDIAMNQQAPKDILLVVNDGILDPNYVWFSEDLFTENSASLNYLNDFKPMDHILLYTFNNIRNPYMDITAYDEENLSSYKALDGYLQSEFLHIEEENFFQFKAGYLDDFDFYRTHFSATISGKGYSYMKFGGPPEVFSEDLFDSDFEIVNPAYDAFQFTATGDFEVASGRWVDGDQQKIRWDIYYPIEKDQNNVVLADLPQEIKTKYPGLRIDNLQFKNASFTDMIINESYDHFIEYLHKNEKSNISIEMYSLSKE